MSARRYLLVFEGDSSRKVDLPDHGQAIVGRGDACEVRLKDQSISRTHARLETDATGVRLVDLGSQNGTLVNSERISQAVPLATGDVITVQSATLVLHAPPRKFPNDPMHDAPSFRRRLDEELERALRYGRPLSVCALVIEPAPERALLNSTLYRCFRRTDFAAWLSGTELLCALPEADETGGRDHARRVLSALPGIPCRAGLAFSPGDGIDLETLLQAALDAARNVDPREIGEARVSVKRLVVGEQAVVVADPAMLRLYDLMERLAGTDKPVLVCGEVGTGKELAASTLHNWSPRRIERLVTVKCDSLPEDMVEAELFGYEKSAFTGAAASGPGVLESTSGGTVFLDQVDALTPKVQGQLLEAIVQHQVLRVGDTFRRPIDVRIVAGTHRELEAEVKAGRFRGDLFAKLAESMLWFPPLRDRPREVPLLARQFASEAAAPLRLGDGALRKLQEYPWPGNVFELREVIDALANVAKGQAIEAGHVEAVLATGR
ncbi:MAG: sigma 54-interacting transcriptional regulator [Archangiaceae bacterium]|nr:sigma 54-interacting transcriptional regulator [Archangiaceae bacterium]